MSWPSKCFNYASKKINFKKKCEKIMLQGVKCLLDTRRIAENNILIVHSVGAERNHISFLKVLTIQCATNT